MKVLVVLNEVTIPGKGERKEGLYRTLIKMHEALFTDISILAGNTKILSKDELTAVRATIPVAKIIEPIEVGIYSLLSYIIALPLNGTFMTFLRYVYVYRYELSAMDKHVKAEGPPSVLTALQSCENSGIIAYLIHRKYGVPYFVMEHRSHYQRGVMSGKRGRIVKTVLASANRVLTVSPQLGHTIKVALGLEGSNITPMPNPIPDDFFDRPLCDFEEVSQFAKNRFIFGGWTNWRDIKRLDLAIEALALVQKRVPDTVLVVAGPVPDWTKNKIETLGLSSSVLLLGSIDRNKVKLLAYQSDCCVIPSDFETFGLPAIESLAAGKPVVTTKCGGPESVIVQPTYGRLVETGDLDGFATAMLDVVKNYQDFDSSKLRAYCRETFGEAVLAKKWKTLYEQYVT